MPESEASCLYPDLDIGLEKLRSLEEHSTITGRTVQEMADVGRYLAFRLNRYPDPLTPVRYVQEASLATASIRSGVDSSTGIELGGALVHLASSDLLERYPLILARAVFAGDFLQEVEAISAEMAKRQPQANLSKTQGIDNNINHSVLIPGRDPFTVMAQHHTLPEKGVLLHGNIRKGSLGAFRLYTYQENIYRHLLTNHRPTNNCSTLELRFGYSDISTTFAFMVEPPDYTQRFIPPSRRGNNYAIPYQWADLDSVDLPSLNHLLILKKPRIMRPIVLRISQKDVDLTLGSPEREIASLYPAGKIAYSIQGAEVALRSLVGLADEDIRIVTDELGNRMLLEASSAA